MREIKEIYESLQKPNETILFQVKNRKTLKLMLAEFEKELESFWDYVYWDKYKEIPIKDIYLFVGRWRLGAAGIFPKHCIYQGEYCNDSYCIDWKSLPNDQWKQEKLVNKFIEIMDKYRKDIKVSRKKYEDVTD